MARKLELEKAGIAASPQVKKLSTLDSQMSNVLQQEAVPLNKRLQQYEELLAEYREKLDKFSREKSRTLNVAVDGVREQINSILMQEGVRFDKQRVIFPLDKINRKRLKKSAASYSQLTYDNAVRYLTAKDNSCPSRSKPRMDIMKKIHPIISGRVDLAPYPNYHQFCDNHITRYNGKWSKV